MKSKLFALCISIFTGISLMAQNIGIGTNAPHASAQLDITSTNKGLLIPRVALADRPASPATGLLIYQTNSTPGFYYYNGSSWVMLNFQLPYTGSTSANNALNITSTAGNAIVGASSAASGGWYGGQFTSASTSGSGVYGAATAASGTTYGGQFVSLSTGGTGVYGSATAPTGISHGGVFLSASTGGYGVKGEATAVTGNTRGGLFNSYSANGVGVYGQNLSLTGSAIGILGETYSTEGMGVAGSAISASGNTRGVFGTNYSTDGVGVAGYAFATTGLNYGVSGGSASIQGVGVLGSGVTLTGANTGVMGQSNSPDGVGGSFYNNSSNNALALKTGQGQVQFDVLAGAGNRMVVANASGKLSTQSIPGSQWTTSGNNIYNANSGRVGIGISSPAANLHVNDGVDGSLLITNDFTGYSLLDGLRLRMNSLVASIQNSENGDLYFQTNQGGAGEYGTPSIWIKPTGAVGIGTSTPGAKLEVAGQVKITGGSPGVGKVLTSDASGLASWTAPASSSQWTSNGNNIYNNNSGFVGVGTNSPGHSLHVHHNGEGGLFDASIQLTNNWSGNAANDGLRIRIVNESTVSILNRENGDISMATNFGATGAYGTPGIWIKPSGATGIGTQNPDGKMEIKGVGSQPVLHLNEGFLKVSGTNKTAFTVTGTAENTSTYILTLNYANQSPNDILLVTHNYNPGGSGGTHHNSATGVYWNGSAWNIYSDDQTTPMLGKSFNVLVIKQ